MPEIARAFLSSESAMERRLGRARRKVSVARIPFTVPSDDLLPERLAGVLRVVYLIYTEGHVATRGSEAVRGDLCEEAIRLARLLVRLMPDESEARGLLALLLLTDARRAARVADGELVALPDQDRSLWDAERIAEGRALIGGMAGPYVIQAAIAALHAEAPAWEATDWVQIAGLYAELERLEPSPVVTVNRAVAVGFADGPRAGLAILDAVAGDERLARYQPLHAARAELLARGRAARGRGLRAAIALTATRPSARRSAAVGPASPPRRELERSLERGAVVDRLAVGDDHVLERQLEHRPEGRAAPTARARRRSRSAARRRARSSRPRTRSRAARAATAASRAGRGRPTEARSPPGSSEPRRIGSSSTSGTASRQYRTGP